MGDLASELAIGAILLGKYRVDAVLGTGGMGVVVRALHLGLGEAVAIKLLREEVATEEATTRFVREAQATARLRSEHVARVSDVGTLETGVPYMVMELLEGADLNTMLETQGRFAPDLAVDLVLQACEALSEAHAAGIVHRDIKPSNLFVTTAHAHSVVKVLDFGISKTVTTDVKLTQTQSMLGTPAYMSPEQMRSAHDVDPRTDVWSIGSVLYELVEGTRPFRADNFSELVVKVSMDPPIAPLAMPPELAMIVLRCLEKSPDARYGSMAELGAALVPFAHDRERAMRLLERMDRRAPGRTPVSMAVARSGPVSAPAPTVTDRPRSRWPLVLAAAFVIAGGGLAFAVATRTHDPPPITMPAIARPQPLPAPIVVPVDAPIEIVVAPEPAHAPPSPAHKKPAHPPHPAAAAVAPATPIEAAPKPKPTRPCDPYDDREGC